MVVHDQSLEGASSESECRRLAKRVKMSTSHRRNEGNQYERRRVEQKDETPELYSIFCGEVASVQEYGAFVKIPGYRKNGLVHKTQISVGRVDDVSEVITVGDSVFCKVISLGEEDNVKISLSMKVVDQGSGIDLDKNLVQTKQEEQRRKKGQTFITPKIELGAVFNTVCKKCGTKGHLARDCFQTPGGKSYDLLPDEEPALSEPVVPQPVQKKKKKDKKKKKSKKRRHRSTSSSSSDSESDGNKQSHHHEHSHKHRHVSKESLEESKRNRHHELPDEERHRHKHSDKDRRASEEDAETLKRNQRHESRLLDNHEHREHHKRRREHSHKHDHT